MNSEKKNVLQWYLGDISSEKLHEELLLGNKTTKIKAEQESVYHLDLFFNGWLYKRLVNVLVQLT